MTREVIDRMRDAAKYEKMAIRALFPENVAGHLDVIEGELHQMVKEIVIDAVKEELNMQSSQETKAKDTTDEEPKVKKVSID